MEKEGLDGKLSKVSEKIQKKEEELKSLKDRQAELRRQKRLRQEKKKQQWYQELIRLLDTALSEVVGGDYMEAVSQEEIAKIVRQEFRGRTDRQA